MVLLQSAASSGICNIETANLDGYNIFSVSVLYSMFLYIDCTHIYSSETNLKIKKARPATYNIACSVSGDDYPAQFMGRSGMHVPTIHAFIVFI